MDKVSNNTRVNSVLNGKYCNIELTLPCDTTTLAEMNDEQKADNPGVAEVLEDGKRMIIPSEIVSGFSREVREKIKVLASPVQCGRLLEADAEVQVNGEISTITFKGVGATSFAIRTRITYWLEKVHRKDDREEYLSLDRELRKRRFTSFQDLGILDLRMAVQEARVNCELDKLGAHAQRCLSIYQIDGLPDADGVIKGIDYFKENRMIMPDIHPVILARSMRTNFRILDLVNLKISNQKALSRNLIEHLCARNKEKPAEYLMRVLERIISNELMLILEGYQIGNFDWATHARNISCEGEELDLEGMKKSEEPDLVKNFSWAQVGRALIYGVQPKFYQENKRHIDTRVLEIIQEKVRASNLPHAQKKAAINTLWSQWRDSEDAIFTSMIKLAGEVAISI